MKQILQSLKNGKISLEDVPQPVIDNQMVLVQNHYSVISAGTEKMVLEMGKMSLWEKAKARPDQVKKVIQKVKDEGLLKTYHKVNQRLEAPNPMGYSTAGVVIAVGADVKGTQPGDKVACAGAGYANHAEVIAVPQNLVAKIPENVALDQACFSTVGAIAMQGLRLAKPQLGETFLVIGLGLIGQVAVQLLRANGCRVIGFDLDSKKNKLAEEQGAIVMRSADECSDQCHALTDGHGVDGVIICASTHSNQPITMAGEVTRERGRVVAVGAVGLDIPRRPYYDKEIEFTVARSYGPGRYDHNYEEKGIDYPYSYVRFTENRNMQAFLQLLAQGEINMAPLMSHRFKFDEALDAYALLTDAKKNQNCMGMIFEYDVEVSVEKNVKAKKLNRVSSKINISLMGAGQYGTGVLLPLLTKNTDVVLQGVATATGRTAERVAKQYGFVSSVGSFNDLLHDETDLIMILSRHNLHAESVVKALAAGKHVYVEKPLALDIESLHAVKEAYNSSDRLLMVGFNRRFASFTRKVNEFMASNVGPKVVNIRVNAGYIDMSSWVQDPKVGGGRIIGEACHFIDLAGALIGANPISVYCRGVATSTQSPVLNDNVIIDLGFADGSIASITYTSSGSNRMPKENIAIYGGGKSAEITDWKVLTLYDGSNRPKKIKQKSQNKGQANMIKSLVQSLQSGQLELGWDSIYATTLASLKAIESLSSNSEQVI